MSIGERLKEERKRLGFNQTQLAERCGASKRSQVDWEKGVASPNAEYLALADSEGVDVLYVVTGRRSKTVASPFVQSYGNVGNVVHAGDGMTIGDISIDMSGGKGRKK